MEGFRVVKLDTVIAELDIVITTTGNKVSLPTKLLGPFVSVRLQICPSPPRTVKKGVLC
jgi:hypothetical protein